MPVIGLILLFSSIFTPVVPAFAEPNESNDINNTTQATDQQTSPQENREENQTTSENTNSENNQENKQEDDQAKTEDTCYDQVEGIGWLVCPSTGVFAKAIDAVYGVIEQLLVVNPVSTEDGSPIYLIWQYARDITNIVFVIMLLVVVWSQLTGVGINNYGIKKTLPRIIIAAILVNLSFLICQIAVDTSNIIGFSLRGFFEHIEQLVIDNGTVSATAHVSWTNLVAALTGGGAIAGLTIGLSGGFAQFLWMLIGAIIAALLAVFVGLITIALRQAVVAILIMISPLAFVAYLLPNTEKYFEKWKSTLFSMLVFYPMFSLLFGASQLAGWTIIASSSSAFGIILGMTVQVVPLFLSISLLKMSSTALGTISSKLTGLSQRFNAPVQNELLAERNRAKQRYFAQSPTTSARLTRFMDSHRRLRAINTEKNTGVRAGLAEIGAQKMIRGKKDYFATSYILKDANGRPILGKDGKPINADSLGFKTNKYTRDSVLASAIAMEVENETRDTGHVLGQFSTYHNKTLQDRQLSARVGEAYKNLARTEITAVNDAEADTDWLVNQYLDISKAKGYAKGTDPHETAEYRHFITSAGGALGEAGAETVLSQVIEKASKNEARHRKQFSILQSKYKYNKQQARAMYTGYFVNDDGIAVNEDGSDLKFARDENGNPYLSDNAAENIHTEKAPGELLKRNPRLLKAYNKHDENGDAYYDMTDQTGQFVTRIYKKDGSAMKELMTNFDMPINDPINGLYGILAGHDEGEFKDVGLPDVGLSRFSTTIGRGLLAARFKEKAAFVGPMYTTSVMNRYVKDYVHQNLNRLDSLIKTGKAGSFNVQDSAELGQLAQLMNPANWAEIFPEDSLRTFVNVNGELLKKSVAALDENGNPLLDKDGNQIYKTVARTSESDGTYEELFRTVRNKWLIPLAPKFASMMGRYTQGTADNQKPGTDSRWEEFYNSLQNYNNPEYQKLYGLKNPFDEQNGFYDISREIKDQIHPRRNRNAKGSAPEKTAYSNDNPASSDSILREHLGSDDIHDVPNIGAQLDIIAEENIYDAASFADSFLDYLDSHAAEDPRYEKAYEIASAIIHEEPFSSTEELHDRLEDELLPFLID